jgi:Ca2+-dependent lipid-binding protein
MLKLTIKSGEFQKDADIVGKQDPFVRFKYKTKNVETDHLDDAGKTPVWN